MTRRALVGRLEAAERKAGANKVRVVFQPYGLEGDALKAWEAENLSEDDNGLTVVIVRWAGHDHADDERG